MKCQYTKPSQLQFAPFVLVPSSFPRKEFEKAVALQPIINRLMHNVAHDEEFITTTLAETIKVDEFTANLFNIYRKVLAHGFTQVRFRQPASIHLRSSCTSLSYPPHPHREHIYRQPVGFSLEFIGPLHPRSQSNRPSINP